MTTGRLKSLLYGQVARVGQALASPKRLEILDVLAQGEKAVEAVAADVAIGVKLASAHLQALRVAHLVQARRDGKRMLYRLSGSDVARLGVALREVAQEHLVELSVAVRGLTTDPDTLVQVGRRELLAQARRGEIVVIDVRAPAEYAAGHLPFARSMPLRELSQRLAELPRDVEIVAYCRGPYCLMSDEAVTLLRQRGCRARKTTDGVAEWQAAGLRIESTNPRP